MGPHLTAMGLESWPSLKGTYQAQPQAGNGQRDLPKQDRDSAQGSQSMTAAMGSADGTVRLTDRASFVEKL